jgi:SAM-dependent methyltransferase
LKPEYDPFADALESHWRSGRGGFRYTRDDGWSQTEDAWWYFTRYRDFLAIERKALRFAVGRILDVGCGAGRHSLYLQRKGFEVTALDSSHRLAVISHLRGVREVCAASACSALPFREGQFDTTLLFGNNLGLCGGVRETSCLLQELGRVTRPSGRVLATTRAPGTRAKRDLDYWNAQLAQGREFGVARFRLDYRGLHPKWVSLLLIAPSDLIRLASENGWIVTKVIGEGDKEEGYAAVLEKGK